MTLKAAKGSEYRQLLSQIKKKDFVPVYLLMGDEPYYLDSLADSFEENTVPEDERVFNQTILYGAETTPVDIINAAQQYPFMSDRRLVLVRETQVMERAKVNLEKLAPYCERPNEGTVLVMVYKGEPFKTTSPLIKSIKKGGGIVFTSNKLKDYELKAPIIEYVTSKKYGIDDDAAEMLAALVGSDLTKLFGEIDKMTIAAGTKMNRLNSALVRSMTGISKEFQPYELSKAVGRRDYLKSMVIITQASRNPGKNAVAPMLVSIFKLFRDLCIIHKLPDKSEITIQNATGSKNIYAARELKEAAGYYNLSQTVEAISALRELDCNIKGIRSQQKEHELLRETIFKIMTYK